MLISLTLFRVSQGAQSVTLFRVRALSRPPRRGRRRSDLLLLDTYGTAVLDLHPIHAVIETPTYLADAKDAGVSDDEREHIVNLIAKAPLAGDIIPGTGGARKRRIGGKGKGKRGGNRIITYYAAEDVPVFLLALVSKGQRADISQADRNAMRERAPVLAESYRAGVRAKVTKIRE
jgi:hypothetical protein